MNCLNCGEAISLRRRKYCSRRCTKDYHNKKEKLERRKINPLLGKKTKLAKEKKAQARKEARKEYEWCKKNMHTSTEIGKALNITSSAAFLRAKKLNIKSRLVIFPAGGRIVFYSTKERNLIENYHVVNIPAGFINRKEIVKQFKFTNINALETHYFTKYGKPKGLQLFNTGITKNLTEYYPLKEVLQWFEEIAQTKASNLIKRKQVTLERQQQKEQQKEQQREQQKELKKQLKEQYLKYLKDNQLFTVKEAASFLGYIAITPLLKSKIEALKGIIKIKDSKRSYYKQPILEEHKSSLHNHRNVYSNCLNCGESINVRGKRGYSTKEYCSSRCQYRDRKSHLMLSKSFDELYEKRTYDKIKYQDKNGILSKRTRLKNLEYYYKQYKLIQNGKSILQKECKDCFIIKDITEYYVDLTYKNVRRNDCKSCCATKVRKGDIYGVKIKSEKSFINSIGVTVLQELSKHNQEYVYMFKPQLWKEIKENLGYTKQDLIKHFEEQFEDWMKWDNNGRVPVGKIRQQHWQMDHIKPRRQFKYISTSDPAFIECWSLNNLRPIDSVDNLMKG